MARRYSFGNLPAPSGTSGAQLGQLKLGRFNADVAAYQAERAADRQDRELELREQEIKDKRNALKRYLRGEKAKRKALAKIEGGAAKTIGGGGQPSGGGGGAPAPLPPIGTDAEPRHDLVFQGGELQQIAQQGNEPLPQHMMPQKTITEMQADMDLRADERNAPGVPQLPPGQGSANFGPFQLPPSSGARGPAGAAVRPGPYAPMRQAARQDEDDRLIAAMENGMVGPPSQQPTEAGRRLRRGLPPENIQGAAPPMRSAQDVSALPPQLDIDAKARADRLVGQATASGAAQSADTARFAEQDEALNEQLRRSRLPDPRVTSPVPGAGVGSQTIGLGPTSRRVPGFPSDLSPTEQAATKRAGGLVLEGAPIATDYAKPRRTLPPPKSKAARGNALGKLKSLRSGLARAEAQGFTKTKTYAAKKAQADRMEVEALGQVNGDFERGVSKYMARVAKTGDRPKTSFDLDAHVRARTHLYDTYTKALKTADPSMHDALKKQYQQWVGTLGDAPLPPKAGLSPEATGLIREAMGKGKPEDMQETIERMMRTLYARVYNAKDARAQHKASRDYETFKSQMRGLEGPDAMEQYINMLMARMIKDQEDAAEKARQAKNAASKK